MTPREKRKLKKLLKNNVSKSDIAKIFGVSRQTIYNTIKEKTTNDK